MKKEGLRKVKCSIFLEKEVEFKDFLGYFHVWGRIQTELSTPIANELYFSKKEVITMGIVEDKNTGQVYTLLPSQITFLND